MKKTRLQMHEKNHWRVAPRLKGVVRKKGIKPVRKRRSSEN